MNIHELIAYPLVLISVLELLLGFLLLRQPQRTGPVHRTVAAISFFAAAFSLNTAVMYLVEFRGEDHIIFARMNWIGWFLIPAALQFTYYLRDPNSRRARIVGYVLYPYWIVMLGLSIFTDLIVTREYVLIPFSSRPGPLEIFGRLSGSAMIAWMIIEFFRSKRGMTGIKKIQLNYFFTGALIFAAAGGVLAGILPVFRGVRLEPGLVSYFSLPWVGLTFYAMMRYSLFEARIIVSRTVAIVMMVLVLSLLQVAMLRVFLSALGLEISILISLSVLGFLLFGTPLSKKVRALSDTMVIGERFDYQEILRESVNALASRENLQDILELMIGTIRKAFGVTSAGLYLQNTDEGYVMRYGRGVYEDMTNRRTLAQIAVDQLRETKRSLVRSELEMMLDDEEMLTMMTYLRGIGASAVIPLFYQDRLRGALALGERGDGASYGQSDIDLLETIARQAAVALENARLMDLARTVRSSLKESEERFQAIARTLPTAIFIHQGGEIKFANAAAEMLTGYTFEELRSMNFWDLIHPKFRSLMREQRLYDQGDPGQSHYNELKLVKKNGDERWVVMTASLIEYGGRSARIWAFFDITNKKVDEGKLRYQQKMETATRLAAGISADFNRILQGIKRAGATIEEGLEKNSPLQEQAEKIMIMAERASWLTRSLVEFGYRKGSKRMSADLNGILMNAEQVLIGLMRKDVKLTIKTSQKPLPLMADPAKIEGVLMGIVINARDAIPEKGEISIETGGVSIDAEFIKKHGYGVRGTYAYFAVTDNGAGMDETTLGQLFEPFFTTKTEEKAVGFSLAIAYDTVKEHGGYITVDSEPGKGSVFTVYLPTITEGGGQAKAPRQEEISLSGTLESGTSS